MFCNMLPISISYFALVLVYFVLFRTAFLFLSFYQMYCLTFIIYFVLLLLCIILALL
jgi:hypothetical protein